MKQLTFFFITILFTIQLSAQNSGKGFSYQAVARDADGEILISQNIELQFGLYPGQGATAPSWQETHVATTDQFGVFSLTVGKGIKSGGDLENYEDLNYGSADYWLKTEIMDEGSFQEISFTKLLSAPYAEYASNASVIPPGTVMPFAGDTTKIPDGWLLCDGSELDRTEYAELFDIISINWGHGDASSTFNIPDFRGIFLRGADLDAGNDPDADARTPINTGGNSGDIVGSFQTNATALPNIDFETSTDGDHIHGGSTNTKGNHSHSYSSTANGSYYDNGNNFSGARYGVIGGKTTSTNGNHSHSITTDTNGNHEHSINSGGDNETRPINAYVNYIIKY
jgi:microcystin-dependent protein